MKRSTTAVVYDLDGTVCDNSQRRHLAPEDPLTTADEAWEEWNLACGGDQPILGMVRRMQWDYMQHQVHICSARSAVARDLTERWMAVNTGNSYDVLKLRSRGDRRPGRLLKSEYILDLKATGIDVVLVYEDLKADADFITEETGVPVLLVNPAYQWIEVLRERAASPGAG